MELQSGATWSIAIFSSRETVETLLATIEAAVEACVEKPSVIDIIINGNRSLADATRAALRPTPKPLNPPKRIRVWYIPVPDKAHAWNQYLHDIWPQSEIAYFVDGYAQVMPDAFAAIAEGMRLAPDRLAATGVPTHGRSASSLREQLLRDGGIHGNLYALRGEVMAQLRSRCYRLPLGIYRTDPTLGAAINFRLDPARNRWDPKCVLVQPNATWRIPPRARQIEEVRSQWKRMLRQAQGTLENLAIQEHLAVRRAPPETLPRTASELILSWIRDFPGRAFYLILKNPLCWMAVRDARRPRDWSQTTVPPQSIIEVAL
jgi:hypothetical protein